MSHHEIVAKLDRYLASHNPISDEGQVVYVMVEIRKLLDHTRRVGQQPSFELLRFYCDWMVHTEKDRITPSVRIVMTTVCSAAKSLIANPTGSQSAMIEFAYMENLRAEMERLLRDCGIGRDVVETGWTSFVRHLVKVLENQPINNPIPEIARFSFVPTAEGRASGELVFTAPIGGRHGFTFLIVY